MKYMGSKKSMLRNGLGELLLELAPRSNRVFDPFCGSSSVSWFVAEKTDRQVIAGDLQKFATDLANSILIRDKPLTLEEVIELEDWLDISKGFFETISTNLKLKKSKQFVVQNREVSCDFQSPITNAYGGYYFSVDQSLKFDTLLAFLPENEPLRSIAVTSLVEAASHCVAAPGHTAQPFQPEGTGLDAIIEAWKRNPFFYVEKIIKELPARHANKVGMAKTSDAIDLLELLEENDLVFLDPPYSAVHYSRFYHVLETISRNSTEMVSGRGRYPISDRRPKSEFSLKGGSLRAFDCLFQKISLKGASAIVTFPAKECSNGMSGKIVKELASNYFTVSYEVVKGHFSTMGGNNQNRPARHSSEELILVLGKK